MSSASELPTRMEQIRKEPKIPSSILPPTVAKQKSQNNMRNSRQVAAANVKTWKDEYADETANVSR